MVTLDGIRRRAAVLLMRDGGDSLADDADYSGDRLAYSLMCDLLAVQA